MLCKLNKMSEVLLTIQKFSSSKKIIREYSVKYNLQNPLKYKFKYKFMTLSNVACAVFALNIQFMATKCYLSGDLYLLLNRLYLYLKKTRTNFQKIKIKVLRFF